MTDAVADTRAAQELLDAFDPFLAARLCEASAADPGLWTVWSGRTRL